MTESAERVVGRLADGGRGCKWCWRRWRRTGGRRGSSAAACATRCWHPAADAADLDIATPELPERVMALLAAAGLRAIPTGLHHGTVSLYLPRRRFEITTLRRDVACVGRHARVEFTRRFRRRCRAARFHHQRHELRGRRKTARSRGRARRPAGRPGSLRGRGAAADLGFTAIPASIGRPWADKIVMPTEWLAPARKSISLIETAALPVVALTAWVTLFIDLAHRAGAKAAGKRSGGRRRLDGGADGEGGRRLRDRLGIHQQAGLSARTRLRRGDKTIARRPWTASSTRWTPCSTGPAPRATAASDPTRW